MEMGSIIVKQEEPVLAKKIKYSEETNKKNPFSALLPTEKMCLKVLKFNGCVKKVCSIR